ncbi:piggyBac transposable element-derived protein 4-like isoform X2 [Patiria miniata]|uniref:PiggyBac transposable element-derived protein domain-containing protein n=1 Tax=Patiria miniata TaxID=46514 RepID=A0A914B927_PATMI|nr:piggyBac transposable element-derived protein 4-like isoform X2 [Patiria miniata]
MMKTERDIQETSCSMEPVRMLNVEIKTEPEFEVDDYYYEIENVWHNMKTMLKQDGQTTSTAEIKQEPGNTCPSDLDEDGVFAGEHSDESSSEFSEEEFSDASTCEQLEDDSESSTSDSDEDAPPPRKRPAFIPPKQAPPPPAPAQPATPAQPKPAAPAQPQPAGQVTSRDGTVWSNQPRAATKAEPPNILMQAMGPKNLGGASSPLELFSIFISVTMLQTILRYTNAEGLAKRGRGWIDIGMMELRSFIGLLFFLGLTKSGHERVKSFWQPGFFSRPLCECTMAGKRFQEILAVMCFDDKSTRTQRKQTDKFAPIRDVFEMFRSTLIRHFSPSDSLTVGEQLLAFRGRCSFKQYMPKKPAKYGLKFWTAVDSRTHYTYNMQPYVKEQGQRETQLGARVVKDMVEPVYGTGRNVTTDNFFTSKALADYLWTKNMTLVGMIKDNRKEVPDDMRKGQTRDRPVKSSHFRFTSTNTLVSFVPKQYRNVLLLSSMHHDATTNPRSKKPEIIDFYNSTKAGVDAVDQMCSVYNCARTSNRWPMVVFFHLLNCAGINAYVLFKQLHPRPSTSRHEFLEQLIMALTLPQVEIRRQHPERLRIHTVHAFAYVGKKVVYQARQQQQPTTRAPSARCRLCPPGVQRRSTRVCMGCERFVCKQHSTVQTARSFECEECAIGE